jgi:hypothetical protein
MTHPGDRPFLGGGLLDMAAIAANAVAWLGTGR